MSSFFSANDFMSTIMMGIPVATVMWVLTNLNAQGGIFADAKIGMLVMIEAAAQEVLRLMAMEWESPLTNLATVHADVPRIVEEIDCCSALVRDGIDLDFLNLVRLNMICDFLRCLGLSRRQGLRLSSSDTCK